MVLDAQKKFYAIEKFKRNSADTGSPEVQVALLTAKITYLSEHLRLHKNDLHSRLGLIKAVNNRRKLLIYLKSTNSASYFKLIQDLGLRK